MKLHGPQVCVSRISGYDSAIERVCVASDSLISGMRRGWALWGGGRASRLLDPCDGEATHGASIRHGFLLVQPSAFSRLKRLPFPCRRSAGRRSSGGVTALGLRRLPAHHPSISSNSNNTQRPGLGLLYRILSLVGGVSPAASFPAWSLLGRRCFCCCCLCRR
jgi:hypothetical protein